MSASLLVKDAMHGDKPRCWNRPPMPAGNWYGIGRRRSKLVLRWYSNPFADICGAWRGTGVGPTAETTHYPQANRWDCSGCRLLPQEHR